MSADSPRRVTIHGDKEVVVDFPPDLTFECVDDCTWCCYHGVLLYEQDFFELANHASLGDSTIERKGQDFIKREDKDREEHVDVDGQACYFLREDGLCELHAEHDWKPARCSTFPLEITVEDGDIHVGIREKAHEHCEGLDVSDRRVIDNLEAFIPEVLWELDDPTTRKKLG